MALPLPGPSTRWPKDQTTDKGALEPSLAFCLKVYQAHVQVTRLLPSLADATAT